MPKSSPAGFEAMKFLSAFTLLSLLASVCVATDPTAPIDDSANAASKPIQVERDAGESLFIAQPSIRPNPVERAPLVAIVDLKTTKPVVAEIEISDADRSWVQPGSSKPGTNHSIAVMGLRPDRRHEIRVKIRTPGSQTQDVSEPLHFTTPPLPKSFPPIRTLIAKPEKMEPGVTLFAVNIWRQNTSMLDYGYIIALDEEGEVVWFCNTTDRIADMKLLSNGHLLYQQGSYRYLYEMDLLGQDHNRWVATNLTMLPDEQSIPVHVDTMHHDTLELPNGNFLTLTTELREFTDFPTSEFDPDAPWAPAHVVCDTVTEFAPSTGKIVDQIGLADLLDKRRFGYMALSGFWKDKYNDRIDDLSRDWSHANALLYVPDEKAVIVSFRHLDCIMKIDWTTKNIIWIFGDPSGWGKAWQKYLLKPVGDLDWTYHQHSPQLTPRGTLMIYDNGNYRARPYNEATLAPDNQSRVVEFEIDEKAMTVKQVFEFKGLPGDEFYCPFYCEADWLPQTGNILVTDGGHIELKDGTPHDNVPGERQWARIFEVTREAPHEKVFEVVCESKPGVPFGWSIYRSQRYPNLYDGFSLKPPAPGAEPKTLDRLRHIKRPVPRD